MLSETNIAGRVAPGWLAEVWNDAVELKERGLPIRGFCWYGFVDHVDWDSALTRDNGTINACGLVGIDRRPHQVGEPLPTARGNGPGGPVTRGSAAMADPVLSPLVD